MKEKTCYSFKEVQKALGATREAVLKLIESGELKAVRFDSEYYIRMEDFNSFLGEKDSLPVFFDEEKKEGERMIERRCYTVKEVQDMLGVSRPAIYDLLKHNDFSYVVAGGKYLISKKSFEDWLEKISQNPERCKQR